MIQMEMVPTRQTDPPPESLTAPLQPALPRTDSDKPAEPVALSLQSSESEQLISNNGSFESPQEQLEDFVALLQRSEARREAFGFEVLGGSGVLVRTIGSLQTLGRGLCPH